MTKDSTGAYHYDYTVPAASLLGKWTVEYKATNGTRISILRETFEVE